MKQLLIVFAVVVIFSIFQQFSAKMVTRIVHGNLVWGPDGRLATNTFLNGPNGLHVIDSNGKDEVVFADRQNSLIRKVDRNGIISTITGKFGENEYVGDGGPARLAKVSFANSVFVTQEKEMYIADMYNQAIRKIDKNGIISTIAGGNGYGNNGDGGPALQAQFYEPNAIFVAEWSNEIYFCDTYNHAVRKILANGTVITIAGTLGQAGYAGDGGLAINAQLNSPLGLAVNQQNEVFISDTYNHVIRKVFSNGTIVLIAGSPRYTPAPETSTWNLDMDVYYYGENIPALQANMTRPIGLFLTKSNELLLADRDNCIIRKIFANQTIVTVVGIPQQCGFDSDTPALNTKINHPRYIFVSPNGDMYFSDYGNGFIRKVDKDGMVRLVAGVSTYNYDNALVFPHHALPGRNGSVYIADRFRHVVRQWFPNGTLINVIGKLNNWGGVAQASTPVSQVFLDQPSHLHFDDTTNELYVAEFGNCVIRKLTSTGMVTTVVGTGECGYSGDGGNANNARLSVPKGFVITKSKDIYVADTYNYVIRKVFGNNGTITTIAGTYGNKQYVGDFGFAKYALVREIQAIAFHEKTGHVYFVDRDESTGQHDVIRVIFANGTINTLIGQYNGTYRVNIIQLSHVNINPEGEIYFVDTELNVARLLKQNGSIIPILGREREAGVSGEDEPPTNTRHYGLIKVEISKTGVMYSLDSWAGMMRISANLCNDYSFTTSLISSRNTTNTNEFNAIGRAFRSCNSNQDYFQHNYIPFIEMSYKSIGDNIITSLLDWDFSSKSSSAIVNGRTLDMIQITVNGCYEYDLITKNCSTSKEYEVIPSSSSNDYLFLPFYTTCTFINYFKIGSSDSVKNFFINLEFFNLDTNTKDKEFRITNRLNTNTLTGLQHASRYNISIQTTVSYSNGITRNTATLFHLAQTAQGIEPSAILSQPMIQSSEDGFFITWSEIDQTMLGVPIANHLEIIYWPLFDLTMEQNQSNIVIVNYNPNTNTPNSYQLQTILQAKNYMFQFRLCNEIGCANSSEPIFVATTYTVTDSSLLLPTFAIILIASVAMVCLVLCIAVTLGICFICCVLLLLKKQQSKKLKTQYPTEFTCTEIVEKEFRIDESKIDMKGSQFLGSGVSGSVITAKYFNRDVAIKIIPNTNLGLQSNIDEFTNELEMLNSKARHHNIIRFFGVYENPVKKYLGLVMELCSHGSIAGYISKHSNLTFTTKVNFIKGIASGMQFLHFQHIAHRDLKCENVLLDDNLTPKIIDFGFSRVIQEDANRSLNLTMNVGTAVYCAPEIIQIQVNESTNLFSKSVNSSTSLLHSSNNEYTASTNSTTSSVEIKLIYDTKCDVYSFGIIMWVIYFQNLHPYGRIASPTQILFKISTDPNFRPMIAWNVVVEEEKWYIELMQQCWKTNPEERPTFAQICKILESK